MVMSGITCQLITGVGRALPRVRVCVCQREREGVIFLFFFKHGIYIQRASHQPDISAHSKVCFPPTALKSREEKTLMMERGALRSETGCVRRVPPLPRSLRAHAKPGAVVLRGDALQAPRGTETRGGSDGKRPTYLNRLGQYFG